MRDSRSTRTHQAAPGAARGVTRLPLRFEDFLLDPDRRELRRAGDLVAVEPQVFDLIDYLVSPARPGGHQGRAPRRDLGRPRRFGIDADQPHQRGATRPGGQRRRAAPDPNHRPQGLSLCRDRAGSKLPTRHGPSASRCRSPALDRPAIAVLPFTNMSGEPEQEYFSDGISEDLITALSKLRWFLVIARNSSFIYKGKSVHLRAGRRGARRALRGGRQRPQKRRPRPHHGAAQRRRQRQPYLGREIRPRPDRRVRGAGRDHRTDRLQHPAAALWSRKLPRPAQAAGKPGCVGPGDARPVALLAGDAGGPLGSPGLSGEGDRDRSRIRAGAWAIGEQLHVHRPYGLDRPALGNGDRRSAPPRRRSAWTARTPGRMSPSAMSISLRGGSTTRWPISRRRCGSIRTSRWRSGITGFRCPTVGAGRRRTRPSAGRCASVLRDPYSAVYAGILAYAKFLGGDYQAAIQLSQSAIRQRSDFVGAHRVLAASAGMAGDVDLAGTALAECRRVQPNISLDWIAPGNADQAGSRPGALPRRVPSRRVDVVR